jgi:hypothetical protein
MKTYLIADENGRNHKTVLNLTLLMGEILEATIIHECSLISRQPFMTTKVSVDREHRLFIIDSTNPQVSIVEYIADDSTHSGIDKSKDLIRAFRGL